MGKISGPANDGVQWKLLHSIATAEVNLAAAHRDLGDARRGERTETEHDGALAEMGHLDKERGRLQAERRKRETRNAPTTEDVSPLGLTVEDASR